MNVEMRGAVEFAGSARSDLCILLLGENEESAFFLETSMAGSLHLGSIQLPEWQQTPSSPLGVERLLLWRPSSPHAPSLSGVSSARFY